MGNRDPSELTIHPAARLVPDWAKDDPRFEALIEDIRERGIDQPLLIDREGRVIDGRKRLRGAKQLQLAQVPVIVRGADEVLGIVVGSLIHRAHWTKGQLAYLLAPLLEDAFQESERRRLANLSKNPNVSRLPYFGIRATSAKEWTDLIGIGRELFRQARELHELFRKYPETRALTDQDGVFEQGVTFQQFYEKRILREDKPYRLDRVKPGIMASLSNKPPVKSGQLDLFDDAADKFSFRFERIKDSPEADHILDEKVAKWSEVLCVKLNGAIKRRLRTEKLAVGQMQRTAAPFRTES